MSVNNAECRKFSPNIFNKSKCSHCFRLKDDHSASALEMNKASRKISKCGYLFVAPDWDFSNPINRTKRWQRRWFVLYDDGELTYSVDDHPETIPQASIDMNKVIEVARADEVTGNPFSVAITAPERVHFVKGTCKEESNWWLEVLQIFPRSSIKTGRAKRNATFPGGIATTYIAQYASNTIQTPPVKCGNNDLAAADKLPSTTAASGQTKSSGGSAAVSGANSLTSAAQMTSSSDGGLKPSLSESLTSPMASGSAARSKSPNAASNNSLLGQQRSASPMMTSSSSAAEHKKSQSTASLDADSDGGFVASSPTSDGLAGSRYKKLRTKSGVEGCGVGTSASSYTRAYRSLRSNTCENLSVIPQDYSRSRTSRYSTTTSDTRTSQQSTAGSTANNSGQPQDPPDRDSSRTSSPVVGKSKASTTGYHKSTGTSTSSSSPTTLSKRAGSDAGVGKPLSINTHHHHAGHHPVGGSSQSASPVVAHHSPSPSSVTASTLKSAIKSTADATSSTGAADSIATPAVTVVLSPTVDDDDEDDDDEEEDDLAEDGTDSSDSSTPASPAAGVVDPHLAVRGVPDGCGGLEAGSKSTTATSGVSSDSSKASAATGGVAGILIAGGRVVPHPPTPQDLLNLKKGWLMKLGLEKEWQKHWFVLQGSALMYFRDPAAENSGLLDGIIDLGMVMKVEERDVQRNYGFVVSTLDEREYILSAVTHGIRNNWINAIKSASANSQLPPSPSSASAGGSPTTNGDAVSSGAASSVPAGSSSLIITRPTGEQSPSTELKMGRRATGHHSLPASPTALSAGKSGPAGGRTMSPTIQPAAQVVKLKREKSRGHGVGSRPNGQQQMDESASDLCSTTGNSMIPERDTGCGSTLLSSADIDMEDGGASSNASSLDKTPANLIVDRNSGMDYYDSYLSDSERLARLNVTADTGKIRQQTIEIANLRRKLDNMNADMDTTLKNLNSEQVKNCELQKKLGDLEQTHSLLQIKSANAEKSLREQSKEITSLNQRVREFSDLSSQYKAQVAENKSLRQKLDKMERLSAGPNWKALYESLQEQHQTERALWEERLKEMEAEMQNMLESSNDADHKTHIITDLSNQLQDSETRINQLLCQNDKLKRENETFKEGYELEINRLKENIKELEEYIDKTDADKSEENSSKDTEILRLRKELLDEKKKADSEVEDLQSKLTGSLAQVEILTSKLTEMSEMLPEKDKSNMKPMMAGSKARSRSLCNSRENLDKQLRMVRMDSLTELAGFIEDPSQISEMDPDKLAICYNDVVNRFHKAIKEIRVLKDSVKKAQSTTDEIEIQNLQLQQTLKNKENHYVEEMKLLTTKIEDLTLKYLAAEKQVRNIKVKLKSVEGKDRRRSSTGLRPDEILIHKEAEHVLEDIEVGLSNLEGFVKGRDSFGHNSRENNGSIRRKSYEVSTKASRARRKSSSDSTDLTFVDRLKKTEKSLADIGRKLSTVTCDTVAQSNQSSQSSHQLELAKRQLMAVLAKAKQDVQRASVTDMIATFEAALASLDLSMNCETDAEVPAFPLSTDISSHLDVVMTFLYRTVDQVYDMRRQLNASGSAGKSQSAEVTATRAAPLYESAFVANCGSEMAKLIKTQEHSFQACLLLALQQQVATIETKFFSYTRDHRLQEYNNSTKALVTKLLEAKNFVPLSSRSQQRARLLSGVVVTGPTLTNMFKKIKNEARQLFSRVGSLTSDLISVLTDAISCQLSDKNSVVEGIRSEVFNLLEEEERLKEFQTSLVNIYLLCATDESGPKDAAAIFESRSPEQLNIMANWDEAVQSQVEVTRILVEQDLAEFVDALEGKVGSLVLSEADNVPHKEALSTDNLGQAVHKISSMIAHKCITEAQITILNTILSASRGSAEGESATEDEMMDELQDILEDDCDDPELAKEDFVYNPDNMNVECNEFMLVLNNYRQHNQKKSVSSPTGGGGGHKTSFSSKRAKLSVGSNSSSGSSSLDSPSLEYNLRSIRKENANKKARLSAALDTRQSLVASSGAGGGEGADQHSLQNLRLWCERSMTAMEKSYENLLSEMQEQHVKEKTCLRNEKEQALAEETRATLAALDAMRKAHESEVQKEVERFKKEFIREAQSKECMGALQSEYQEDLDVIRREILSVTHSGSSRRDSSGLTDPGMTSKLSHQPRGSPSLPRLTRSPSCPRLNSAGLSLPTAEAGFGGDTKKAHEMEGDAISNDEADNHGSGDDDEEEPGQIRSPLAGMVAHRKRVFESDY